MGKNGWLAVKLDLAKAYDLVEWLFLEKVLRVISFCPKLIQLIMWFVSSATLSVLWSGKRSKALNPNESQIRGCFVSIFICLMLGGA